MADGKLSVILNFQLWGPTINYLPVLPMVLFINQIIRKCWTEESEVV